MKLFERLIEHHGWSMHRILDRCRTLSVEQLDSGLGMPGPYPWENSEISLRRLLIESVQFAAPWLETINGARPEYDKSTIDGMHVGLQKNVDEFLRLVSSIEQEGRWDMTFVDSLCNPPEVFSYVGVVGHVITFNAFRRVLLLNELRKHGIDDLGFGDPIEYDPQRR